MSNNTEIAAVLRAASNHIKMHGWLQGNEQPHNDPTKPCCMMVALGHAVDAAIERDPSAPRKPRARDLWESAKSALKRRLHWSDLLSGWNDHPSRTVDEVHAALNGAADDVESTNV